MQQYKVFLMVIGVSLWSVPLMSQKIELRNPSFEDVPRHSLAPSGWYDCGAVDETPPDVQPGFFGVDKKAANQSTYMGLVTRDNDTWEGVAQRLENPLQAGQCYDFSLSLARSENYLSLSKTTRVMENFNGPVKIRIWGGTSFCSKKEKLAETAPVSHTTWKEYKLKLNPTGNYNYIFIEAFYKPTLVPYNGNVLVDNCSAFIPCDEEVTEPPIASTTDKPVNVKPTRERPSKPAAKPEPPKTEEPVASTTTKPETPSTTTATKPAILPELERSKIRKGQVIRVDKLYFPADTFIIEKESYEVLDEIYTFLKNNPDVTIEVGGHTNSVPEPAYCDWLSEARAKEVVKYLIDKGIDAKRLKYKGYGKRKPVATNRTASGRKRNQRVEIKILDMT